MLSFSQFSSIEPIATLSRLHQPPCSPPSYQIRRFSHKPPRKPARPRPPLCPRPPSPPTTTTTTTTEPPVQALGDPIALEDLTLGAFSLGPLDFGDADISALGRLVATFGQPDDVSPIGEAEGLCPTESGRSARFGWLTVLLRDEAGTEVLVAYRLEEPADAVPGHPTADLRTISSAAIGATAAEWNAIYGTSIVRTGEVDGTPVLLLLRSSDERTLLWGPPLTRRANGDARHLFAATVRWRTIRLDRQDTHDLEHPRRRTPRQGEVVTAKPQTLQREGDRCTDPRVHSADTGVSRADTERSDGRRRRGLRSGPRPNPGRNRCAHPARDWCNSRIRADTRGFESRFCRDTNWPALCGHRRRHGGWGAVAISAHGIRCRARGACFGRGRPQGCLTPSHHGRWGSTSGDPRR